MTNANRLTPESFASQFEPKSGLAQWWIWLIMLSSACGFVLFAAQNNFPIFGTVKLLDIAIYGTLAGLGAATIILSFLDARFIDRQTKIATIQVAQLNELDDVTEFLEQAETSIFRMHIESLYNIFLAHSEISQDNLIEILQSRLLSKNRVVELFSSILITLGLIGTIIGLILMTNNLGQIIATVGGDDTEYLMQQIAGEGGPLGSLGVAFYTTLIGAVLGGVILRILSSIVDANITRYTAHIAELTEVNVLPFMRNMAKNLEESGYYKSLHSQDH